MKLRNFNIPYDNGYETVVETSTSHLIYRQIVHRSAVP